MQKTSSCLHPLFSFWLLRADCENSSASSTKCKFFVNAFSTLAPCWKNFFPYRGRCEHIWNIMLLFQKIRSSNITYLTLRCRISHPLNDFPTIDNVNVGSGDHFFQEFSEGFTILFVFKPSGMEVQSQRCTVTTVMSLEINHENVKDFVLWKVWRTTVNESASVLFKH